MGIQTSTGLQVGGTTIKTDSIKFNKQFDHPEDPNAVVANFCKYLLPQDLTPDQATYLKQSVLLTGQVTDGYWTSAWNNYIANPNDAMAESIVHSRLDKLVNYITSMEEYQLY